MCFADGAARGCASKIMLTSDSIAAAKISHSAPGVQLLSTAAMIGGADARDDALRQGEAAHVGAELAAAKQGERQGGALHGLQPVGDAVGDDTDQRQREVAAVDRKPRPGPRRAASAEPNTAEFMIE